MGWRWSLIASTDSVRSKPPMGVGWPPEDTMNLKTVEAVYTVVIGEPGHPDQYPYTDSWLGLAQDAPTWIRFCIQKGKGKILMAQKLTDDKKGNSTGFGQGWPSPSPILDNDAPTAQCSRRTGGRLSAWSRARWSPAAAAAPLPALLEVVELPPWRAPIPVTEPSGQHFQDPAPAKPPKLYLPLPVSYWSEGEGDVGIKQRLRSAREPEGTKNRQEIYNASYCSGKVYLGPSRKPPLPQGQDSPSTGPSGGPWPCYSQTSVPGAEVLATGRMNALRQGRRRKLLQLWGLLAWKLNRAARAQRY